MGAYGPGRPAIYHPFTGKGKRPPASPGEYRIRNKKGTLTYIGETNNLERRMKEHLRNGKMSGRQNKGGTFEWKTADRRSTSVTRREHERRKIKEHTPSMNKSKGGEGRIGR